MSRALAVLKPLIRQVPPTRSARLAMLFAAKRLAEPWTMLSFGQRGEDLILDGLLQRLPDVARSYVDVGSNHPVRNSNTYRLYLRGWRGVLVDANAELVALSARLRPHDRVVCAAVSDVDSERVFRIPIESRRGGFLDTYTIERGTDRLVATRTLTSILDEAAFPHEFGLLSVDCEGSDDEVIRSLDFERYRPKVIVVEQETLDLRRLEGDRLVAFLRPLDYELAAYDGMNGYYTDRR
jgi:FkbM family methyltransferase